MTDLHNLYLVACPKPSSEQAQVKTSNPAQQIADLNSAFYLTKTGASEQITILSQSEEKQACKQALQTRIHAANSVKAFLSKRQNKPNREQINAIEAIRDKQLFEELREKRKNSLLAENHQPTPELSAMRKLFYQAALDIEAEKNQQVNENEKG